MALWPASLQAEDKKPEGREKVVPRSVEDLRQKVVEVLRETKTPGAGIALVSRDAVIWTGGVGLADVAAKRPATAETLFRLGSVSKGFVALSVLMLAEEGQLSLDDTFRSRAPEIAFENHWESTDPVRIVNLLEHTAGFDDISLREFAHNQSNPLSLQAGLAYNPVSRHSRWRPGTRFAYCNAGPPMAAYVVEKISGQRFEDFVGQRIFAPLGMRTATYFFPQDPATIATLYHDDGVTPFPYWNIIVRPSGAINASAAEMARYVQLYLNRGALGEARIVSHASIARMERPVSGWTARAGLETGYGLNNFTTLKRGFVWRGHDGGVAGGLATMEYLPEHGVGFTVMINGGSGKAIADIDDLCRNFLTKDLAKPTLPPPAAVPTELRSRFSGWYVSDNPRRADMYFLERLLAVGRVTVSERELVLKPLIGKALTFVPVTERTFREAEDSLATLALFDHPEEGRFLQGDNQTMRPVAAPVVWIRTGVGAASLVLMITDPLFALIWLPRKVFGRMKTVKHLSARVWPLLCVLSLFGAVGLIILGQSDLLARFGTLTPWSFGFFSLTLLGAAFAVVGLVKALRTPAAEVNRWALWHSRLVAIANAVVFAYLGYWGVIGWRTWA